VWTPRQRSEELLERYVEATEKADIPAFEALIREDGIFRMPPEPQTYAGRETMIRSWVEGGFGSPRMGELRCVLTRANRQPAVAAYVIKPGDTVPRALAMDVLRIEEGLITEIVTFPSQVFEAFGLPATL